MTTDKQLALAAIESLNKARDLLESSSDAAQHAIADGVADIVLQLKKLEFFGRPLVRSVCTDDDVAQGQAGRYLITEEHNSGYIVIARFAKLADAKRALAEMEGR